MQMRKIFAFPSEIVSIIGSHQASRFSTTFTTAIISLTLSSIGLMAQPAKSVYDFPNLDSITFASLCALVTIANWLIHKKLRPKNRALATGLAWLVSTICSMAVAFSVVSLISQQPIPQYRLDSMFFDVLATFVNLASYSIVIAAIARYRQSSKALRSELSSLALLRKGVATQISQVRERYSRQVRGSVEPVLTELTAAIQALDANEVMQRARAAIEQVVLPLNREIETYVSSELDDIPEPPSDARSRITFREIFTQRIQLSSLILPFTTSIIFVASLLGAFVYIFGEQGLAAGLLSMVVLFIMQLATLWALRSLEINILFAAVVSFAACALAAMISVYAGASLLNTASIEAVKFLQLGVFIVTFAIAIFQIAIVTTNSHLERIAKLNDDYAALLKNRDAKLRKLKLRISNSIHADVQGKLRAVLLRVKSGGLREDNISQLTDDLNHIQAVLRELGAEREIDFLAELAALKEFWSGVCEIEFDKQPQALQLVSRDRDLAGATVEVIVEAIANAVKHGSAKTVNVTLDSEDEVLKLSVQNDTNPIRSSVPSTGSGSRRFDDLCRSWSLSERDSLTVFEAELISTK